MKRPLLLSLLLIMIVGCASTLGRSSTKMNMLSIGMTKAEVIDVMGAPDSTSAIKGTEYLSYNLLESSDGIIASPASFFVRIVDGKVDAYGRTGDFDSTKVPEEKKTIDLHINK